ncbi:MAG: glycosyltransferase [Candidatus Omnitrophica bacterium]|nr:glycosyltransferase [Candidatus Omnitrophota bacterium]
MKVALVHDWLTGMRGGEKCLEVFCELFPDATLFTLLHKKGALSPTIEHMNIKTSFIQRLPLAVTSYRNYLPLFPRAIESFDLSGFDFVLSSSHCVAKGVRVPQGAVHICFCHTPMRYAWLFFQDYFGAMNPLKKALIFRVINRLKAWDQRTNESVDFFIATSDNVKKRIKDFYGRNSDIINPPVDTDVFSIGGHEEDYYLMVSALVPYKRVDLAIQAFNDSGRKLIIIGTGNVQQTLRRMAKDNITFLGWVDDAGIRQHYQRCRALIFPGEEDFGIVPLEAQACGKPVIAYGRGGALETITKRTGVFFYEQTPQALNDALKHFEANAGNFKPDEIRNHALRFSRVSFKEKIKQYIISKVPC